MSLTIRIGLALLLCSSALVALAVDPAQSGGGVSRGLLIGINHYKSVPGLQGSVNDVETMREILTTRWGFSPENIKVLEDEAATREGMLAAFNELVSTAGPNDVVYVHYSGHGSQVQDLNGDEPDGLDETIVPQDGRSPGVPDIVDDEIDAIFSKLRAKSALIVLDSCHSGTATRAFDIRTRSVPRDERIDLYRTGVTATSTRSIVPLERSRFVVMSGAADNEEALDGPVEGRYHGFFTYALSRSIGSAPANATPRDIFAGVGRELTRIQTTFGRTSMPEPQLEAPPEALDQPIFARAAGVATGGAATGGAATGGATAPSDQARLAWLRAQPAATGFVTLVNGLLLGATPGTTWAIYPPNEQRFAPGRASVVATVTDVSGSNANARVSSDAPVQPGSRAVALMPAPSAPRIAMRLNDVPAAQQARVRDMLAGKIPGVQWVGPQEAARFIVDMQGSTVRLLTADGLGVVGSFAIDDERAIADIARIASRTMRASELLALDNPSSRLLVTARVASAQTAARDIVLVAAATSARLHSRRSGEPRSAQNSLQLSVSVSQDAYLTIVDVDTEGNTSVLFPNPYQRADFAPDGVVRGGRETLIPDALQPGNRAGFYWDYSPPAGTDTVRVFATTDLATANLIRGRVRALQQSAQSRGIETRSIGGGLAGLRDDLTQLATRGIKVVADEGGATTVAAQSGAAAPDWAAASVTVDVSE